MQGPGLESEGQQPGTFWVPSHSGSQCPAERLSPLLCTPSSPSCLPPGGWDGSQRGNGPRRTMKGLALL